MPTKKKKKKADSALFGVKVTTVFKLKNLPLLVLRAAAAGLSWKKQWSPQSNRHNILLTHMLTRLLLWAFFSFTVFYDLHRLNGGISFQNATAFALALNSVGISWCISLLIDCISNKKKQRLIATIYAFISAFGFYYFLQTKNFFSYSLFLNHIGNISSTSGLSFFLNLLHETFFFYHVFNATLFSLLIFASYTLSELKWYENIKSTSGPKFILMTALVTYPLVSLMTFSFQLHPLSYAIKSVYSHYFPQQNQLSALALHNFPVPPKVIASKFSENRKAPHIFLIIVESLNHRTLHKFLPSGEPVAPFLHHLAQNFFSVKNYFSNSVYTSKGHFAIFCSQIPHLKEPEFLQDFSKKCLPEYLAQAGYSNFLFQADTNINVHSVKDFFSARQLQLPDLAVACQQNATKCVNHFLSDYEFYNEFFKFTEVLPPEKPHFFALATLQNHMPFTFSPSTDWIYPSPKNRYENYINSVRNTDKQIAHFFELLKKSAFYKDSIVIITGDHSFPLGERGNDRNENFAYQENFDVPLIIVDHRKNLKELYPGAAEQTSSHLNLAPTILDLAGISVHSDFIANSLFSHPYSHRPIYLVQPHSGGYQATIRWPYKYIFSEVFQSEELYDLESDPMEKNPISLKEKENVFTQLRRQASYIYSQQKIYDPNKKTELKLPTAKK